MSALPAGPALLLAAAGALAACEVQAGGEVPPDLLVSVRDGGVHAPDSVGSGWTRLRVEEDGAGHILVLFWIPDTTDAAGVTALVAALDTAAETPRPATAIGGPEMGDVGDVVVELTPGRYLLACVRRGDDGHRHALAGESRVLVVTRQPIRPRAARAPAATQVVGMVNFAYLGPDTWPAGTHLLRLENRSEQEHQLRVDRLKAGASLKDWMEAEDTGDRAEGVAGMARMGSGAVAYLPLGLPRGRYVLYCLITDPATGRTHAELGMVREIQVE